MGEQYAEIESVRAEINNTMKDKNDTIALINKTKENRDKFIQLGGNEEKILESLEITDRTNLCTYGYLEKQLFSVSEENLFCI